MTVKLPSVLSIQRGTIVTDGIFYSTIPTDNGPDTRVPVNVVRHGIRGTNINPKKGDPANIQLTESAKTEHQANALEVEFSFATVPAEQLIFQCSDGAFRGVLDDFIQQYFVRGVPEFDELCRRYARNILNGRWLWRNRTLGGVSVLARNKGKAYHSTGSTTLHFQNYTADEQALADEVVAAGFLGTTTAVKVVGRVDFGFQGRVEVFPSQNMVTSKPTGFARSLYKANPLTYSELRAVLGTARGNDGDAGEIAADMIVMGNAALRDQKIGNALRTIDTWYSGCNGLPIPVEPNGANLESGNILRDKKSQTDYSHLFTLIDTLTPGNQVDPRAIFLMALLVRGGVFSEK